MKGSALKTLIISVIAFSFLNGAAVYATQNSSSPGSILEPVEMNEPETDFKPSFPGQTRIGGIKTEKIVKEEVMAEGLKNPWAIEELPDGRFIVTERTGGAVIVDRDGNISEPIGGFPETDSSGQGGILDVLPAEDFEESRILYFTLSEKTSEGSVTAVGKGKLSEDEKNIENFAIIYRALPYFSGNNHYGSRMAFDGKGNLLVTTGERFTEETRVKAQDLDNGYGKILKITTEGKHLEDNPFIEKEGAMPEIYSYGHRNVQGIAVSPETGFIWIAEMGPQGGDELNIIEPGKNYGWPVISYGEEYSGSPVGEGIAVKEGMEQPVYYWDPVVAPSGMDIYTSDKVPEWKMNLFIGGLKGKHIVRIKTDGKKVVGEERLLEDLGERWRDVTSGKDGALYAVTDSGRLYRIIAE